MSAASPSTAPISITLRVWRQAGPDAPGKFVDYQSKNLNPNMSFLEMLDVVNDELTTKGEEPIAFAHDCREGICGTCSCSINGNIGYGIVKAIAFFFHRPYFSAGDTIYF